MVPWLVGRGLTKTYGDPRRGRASYALGGVDLEVAAGERLALVGRSGSGKSTLGRVLALHERPERGLVLFGGRDPWGLSAAERDRLRPTVQLIHQDPSRALDPRDSVLSAVAEPLGRDGLAWTRSRRAERRYRALAALDAVGLDPGFASRRVTGLSGGQKRRLVIARALLAEPRILILDEAFSGLDLSLQARLAARLDELARRRGLGLILVTHDLRAIAGLAERLVVLAAGQIVEEGRLGEILRTPRHPETRALMAAASMDNNASPPGDSGQPSTTNDDQR